MSEVPVIFDGSITDGSYSALNFASRHSKPAPRAARSVVRSFHFQISQTRPRSGYTSAVAKLLKEYMRGFQVRTRVGIIPSQPCAFGEVEQNRCCAPFAYLLEEVHAPLVHGCSKCVIPLLHAEIAQMVKSLRQPGLVLHLLKQLQTLVEERACAFILTPERCGICQIVERPPDPSPVPQGASNQQAFI